MWPRARAAAPLGAQRRRGTRLSQHASGCSGPAPGPGPRSAAAPGAWAAERRSLADAGAGCGRAWPTAEERRPGTWCYRRCGPRARPEGARLTGARCGGGGGGGGCGCPRACSLGWARCRGCRGFRSWSSWRWGSGRSLGGARARRACCCCGLPRLSPEGTAAGTGARPRQQAQAASCGLAVRNARSPERSLAARPPYGQGPEAAGS